MQMRSSTCRLFACLAVMALAGSPMVAAADEFDSCVDLSDDLAVAGCSRAIDSHEYTGRSLARLYSRRGGAYQAQGDLERAMADLDESVRIDPTYPSAYSNRGAAWYRRGDLDRAIADFNTAIRLDPKYEYAYVNRGAAWGTKGNFDRAIADFDTAIRLNPKDAEAYYNRGRAWKGDSDLDRAIADYSEAIRLDPKYEAAYLNRGSSWGAKGQFGRAIADFDQGRSAVCKRHWLTSKRILNSLHRIQMAQSLWRSSRKN
jgi:tetratricopeptide (TPR) repeat protein